jgi:hypothetical protein
LLALFLLPVTAHAANVSVGCPGGSGGTYSSIGAALTAIAQTGPSTINVTGTCSENVIIDGVQSITIAGSGGAKIVEPLDNNAFDISRSRGIILADLDISSTGPDGGGVVITDGSEVHIVRCNVHNNQSVGVNADTGSVVYLRDTIIEKNTPNDGLDVFDNSTVNVRGTTIQNNGDSVSGTAGVFVGRNSVLVFHETNSILNNANIGIQVRNLSTLVLAVGANGTFTTIQGHLTNGIILQEGSHLQGNKHALIEGNGSACPLDPTCGGIFATENSTVDIAGGTISGNHGSGISVQQGANVQLARTTVSNNTGDGVHIQWISIGSFISGNTITGNGGASVFCDGRSLALGDLSAFSKVRCREN